MKSFFWLLLTLTTIANVKESYSINTFIEDLKEGDLYEVIYEVNYYKGNDVAIDFCYTVTESGYWESLVRVHLDPPYNPPPPCPPGYQCKPPPMIPSLIQIIYHNLDILEANLTPEKVNYILNKYS